MACALTYHASFPGSSLSNKSQAGLLTYFSFCAFPYARGRQWPDMQKVFYEAYSIG